MVVRNDDGTFTFPGNITARSIGRVEEQNGESYREYIELEGEVTQEWVSEHFQASHCQHEYDCCACWYPCTGILQGYNDITGLSIVSQAYHLNI